MRKSLAAVEFLIQYSVVGLEEDDHAMRRRAGTGSQLSLNGSGAERFEGLIVCVMRDAASRSESLTLIVSESMFM